MSWLAQVCVTAGMLTGQQAQQLAGAGLTAYNHNLDTSPEYYSTITSSRKYQVLLQHMSGQLSQGLLQMLCGAAEQCLPAQAAGTRSCCVQRAQVSNSCGCMLHHLQLLGPPSELAGQRAAWLAC